jgi:hypothetical protein
VAAHDSWRLGTLQTLVLKFPEMFSGLHVAVVCSGGNADPHELS